MAGDSDKAEALHETSKAKPGGTATDVNTLSSLQSIHTHLYNAAEISVVRQRDSRVSVRSQFDVLSRLTATQTAIKRPRSILLPLDPSSTPPQ